MKKAKLSKDYVRSSSSSDSEEDDSEKYSNEKNNEKYSNEKNDEKYNGQQSSSKQSSKTSFELSTRRRITLRKFKSNILIDIREFYEDRSTGEELPGKKGISLTVEQFLKFKELIPMIEASIEAGNFE